MTDDTKHIVTDVTFEGFRESEGFTAKEPPVLILYKAARVDHCGLELEEPVIMVCLEINGERTPWVDGSRIQSTVTISREWLLHRMDKDWVPNQEQTYGR